ncbi:hypothetical protein IF1G_00702 [Cordyceps javanica]|uniref:Uncharacterized protein n=1 Tax=Cordyceps javanica TaxID=43265 RepID=A0A545WD91_9HYPO|nr:hypothetical protein IF1G_00702 [Cordyceps javanica]TQW11953.1 hypothetical protein IF2G_00684 [Cordyceps javanica]
MDAHKKVKILESQLDQTLCFLSPPAGGTYQSTSSPLSRLGDKGLLLAQLADPSLRDTYRVPTDAGPRYLSTYGLPTSCTPFLTLGIWAIFSLSVCFFGRNTQVADCCGGVKEKKRKKREKSFAAAAAVATVAYEWATAAIAATVGTTATTKNGRAFIES